MRAPVHVHAPVRICMQIQGEIKSQLTMARAALGTSVNTMKELVQQLCTALELQVSGGLGLGSGPGSVYYTLGFGTGLGVGLGIGEGLCA